MAKNSASGKKLRRCKPSNQCFRYIHGLPSKVSKGPLHKINGPRNRWNAPGPVASWLDKNFKIKKHSESWIKKGEDKNETHS